MYVTVLLLILFRSYFMALELRNCWRHRSVCKHSV